MRLRLALLLVALFATGTACAPVVLTPAAIGPAELQRYSDAATNTAAAVHAQATQDARHAALATATGQSARETSTAAYLATHDALAVESTRTVLQVTVVAAAGFATDAAAARTDSAHQTQAWATPTAAAIRTQAAATVADHARQQASAENAAAFWNLLRWTVLAAIAGVVIVVCVLILVRGVAFIYTETMRERASIAREAFKVLAPGHWAEWTAESGYQVYLLPGALDEPPTIVENVITAPHRLHAWRHAVRLFAWWGDRYGFSIRELTGAGVVTDPVWRTLSKLLKDAGVLAEVRRAGQRGTATAWADGWDYRRFADELERLELAFPEQGEPPKVAFAVPVVDALP